MLVLSAQAKDPKTEIIIEDKESGELIHISIPEIRGKTTRIGLAASRRFIIHRRGVLESSYGKEEVQKAIDRIHSKSAGLGKVDALSGLGGVFP